jgi:hypothetical protein
MNGETLAAFARKKRETAQAASPRAPSTRALLCHRAPPGPRGPRAVRSSSGVSTKFRRAELSHLPVDNFNDFSYNQSSRNQTLSGGMPGDRRSDRSP